MQPNNYYKHQTVDKLRGSGVLTKLLNVFLPINNPKKIIFTFGTLFDCHALLN